MKKLFLFSLLGAIVYFSACKTKGELKREQEFEQLKQEVTAVRGDKVDVEVVSEEVRSEIGKLRNSLEEREQAAHRENEELRKEVQTLTARIQALEQRAVAEEAKVEAPPPPPPKITLDGASRLYQDGKYDEAIEALKPLSQSKGEQGKKAQFLLAESYFAAKEFATSALEFKEYRDSFPKDGLIPNAIYRQANCFKSMGKKKEARLFYQELIEKYPKHALTAKAKTETKKLK